MKAKQLEIIKKYNPCLDGQHTWIRTIKDIKTFNEALLDPDYADEEDFCPDYTRTDAEKALEIGYITVFSSHPIEQGAFVTPSRMIAHNYAGTGKIYSRRVPLADVAWIDITEGQYANTTDEPS